MHERADVEEQLEGIQTSRLLCRARKYYIVAPEIKLAGDNWEDANRARGWASDTLYLKPAVVASIQRQIEDAKKRRLEAWGTRSKIIGGLITIIVALASVLALIWRR